MVTKRSTNSSKVFFCSRTHTQLQQVIHELRHCSNEYIANISMCILGSRSQLCVNEVLRDSAVKSRSTLEDICSKSIRARSCPYSLNLQRLAHTLSAQKVWDIEDAVTNGKKLHSCAYFTAKSLLENANYVFAPYNYIIDQSIRTAMKIDLKDAVVIFDEAHNIESICRDAGSAEFDRAALQRVVDQLALKEGSAPFEAFSVLVKRLLLWIEEMKDCIPSEEDTDRRNSSSKDKFLKGQNVWDGVEALYIFETRLGLTNDSLQIYVQHLQTIQAQQEDLEVALQNRDDSASSYGEDADVDNALPDVASSDVIFVLSKLVGTLRYMMRNECEHAADYRVVLSKRSTWSGQRRPRTDTVVLNIWCLNSAVVFK